MVCPEILGARNWLDRGDLSEGGALEEGADHHDDVAEEPGRGSPVVHGIVHVAVCDISSCGSNNSLLDGDSRRNTTPCSHVD